MKSVALLALAVAGVLSGCLGPAGEHPPGEEGSGWDGRLVLFMTSATHSMEYGAFLAPTDGAPKEAPVACEVDTGGRRVEDLSCGVDANGPFGFNSCTEEADPEPLPWIVAIKWTGDHGMEADMTATARDAAGDTVATWDGETLPCAGHLTE